MSDDYDDLVRRLDRLSDAIEKLQAELAAANADAEALAADLQCAKDHWGDHTWDLDVALTAHHARVGEKPLRCDNCGKTMAEHGPLANCHARIGGDK